MASYVVTGVDEPRLAGSYPTGKADGIIDGLVRVVGLVTKGIDDEHLGALKIGKLGIGNGFHVCDIGQLVEAVAEDGQVVVHHLERHDGYVANGKGLVAVYLVQLDSGNTWIAMLRKAIWQHLEHSLASQRVGIDVDLSKLTIGPYIVHASHVVVVSMGDEYAVNLAEGLRKNLLSEVWATVYEQSRGFGLDEC